MTGERLDAEGEGRPTLRVSPVYTPAVIDEIQEKAVLGRYRIRGFGTLRARPLPSLDDLTFLPASLTRIPLEGYRERCRTTTVLGTRFAEQPIELDIPVMITVAVACLPIFFTGYVISRWNGALFVAMYVGYVAYLFFNATDSEMLGPFSVTMLAFVLPVTFFVLGLLALRYLRQERAARV